ncbi:hypothetical protein [Streptomyces canus]|uniref:hypothetical protein n=1 Tax=Streptomyces canus TaxID=58343 RepID=UPI00371F52E7
MEGGAQHRADAGAAVGDGGEADRFRPHHQVRGGVGAHLGVRGDGELSAQHGHGGPAPADLLGHRARSMKSATNTLAGRA